ncbi:MULTISPECIES: hypothetical protein [Micromonospora]|uniref:hypothetical protein n=1 Tax=Micromonospora TaxID=1873 RepID=UPI0021C9F3FA|nr:hypothetical protein [Micromonospora sp. Mcm103]
MDAADLGPDELVARVADLLRSAHPLRIGSAVRRAGELLACVAPPHRAALMDRAIHLTLTDEEEDSGRSHIATS